jgi:dTDP-4-dehydrorhamnose 3,5-epimerase
MHVIKTDFPDLVIIEPTIFGDSRGYFFESYNYEEFKNKGIPYIFVQDNQSKSSFGVLRGLHYQLNPYSQTKLIRVLQGTILDVVVDIRKGSPSYGRSFSIELSDQNNKQLLVPHGFAHGFSVISDTAVVFYKCDSVYHPEAERGIIYNDPKLKIDWKIDSKDAILSKKDLLNLSIDKAEMNFEF